MKKSSLFIIVVLVIFVVGCLGKARPAVNKPVCPEWAAELLGVKYCDTLPLSITPDDNVALIDWQIGEIILDDSYVDNVYGVQFLKPDGTQIEPKDMEEGIIYSFKKTTATAGFHIWPNTEFSALSSDTNVLLAKP